MFDRLRQWFRKPLCGRPFRHTAKSRAAMDHCRRFYRAHNLPLDVERQGLARLEAGFRRYGPDAFTQMSAARWLQEPLDELLDAFNMLGGMLRARGEEPLPLSSLEVAILDVRARLNKPAGGASAPIVAADVVGGASAPIVAVLPNSATPKLRDREATP